MDKEQLQNDMEVLGKLVIDEKQLKKDMEALAKLAYKLSMKYGDIYISVAKVTGVGLSSVIYQLNGESDYRSAIYWGDKEDKENG